MANHFEGRPLLRSCCLALWQCLTSDGGRVCTLNRQHCQPASGKAFVKATTIVLFLYPSPWESPTVWNACWRAGCIKDSEPCVKILKTWQIYLCQPWDSDNTKPFLFLSRPLFPSVKNIIKRANLSSPMKVLWSYCLWSNIRRLCLTHQWEQLIDKQDLVKAKYTAEQL